MSTILKALRRLENDDTKKKRGGAPPVLRDAPTSAPLPPTDPRAADALRGRILAEEAAARVVSNLRDESRPNTSRIRPILVRALGAILVVAALLFALTKSDLFTDSEPDPGSPVATAEPMPPVAPVPTTRPSTPPSAAPSAPRAMVAVPNPLAPADPASAASPPAPTSMPAVPTPIAAPPPTAAVAPPTQNAENARAVPTAQAAQAAPSTAPTAPPTPTPPTQTARVTPVPEPLPAPTVAAQTSPAPPTRAAAPAPIPQAPPEPRIQAAPQAQVAPEAEPLAAPVARPTPTDVAAHRPAAGVPSDSATSSSERELVREPAPSVDFKRVAPAGLPEITVVRTAWHPKPERRSAKVRIVETDELVTVREGDTVAGLVLLEITPSAVVFSAGDVEIRRRVGEASAGR